MTPRNYISLIAKELNLTEEQVKNTLELLDSGATIPFIARYRKEATDSLDEVQIAAIRDLYAKWIELDKRRMAIIDSINEQGKMTPELEESINNANTLSELEDLYLPYRPKRKTRATVAIEKGLEPLAATIFKQPGHVRPTELAAKYVNPEKGVATVNEALAGARDIIAEWASENVTLRRKMRSLFVREAMITSKVVKDKAAEGEKYEIYFISTE